jgi:effector-binding domain-containing protein/carbon monoxide dehydrogenase subunit G
MLKKVLLGVVAVVAVFVIIGWLLPRQVRIERSTMIERPASLVYATTNSFQRFGEWSPWQEMDPAMKVEIDGPREGVGARLTWSGNDAVGSGVQTIAASVANESVTTDLVFDGMPPSKAVFQFSPQDVGTRVTWSLETDMGLNPIARWFGLTLDSMVGKDFARGLDRLKAVVEQLPNVDIADFKVERVVLEGQQIAYVAKSTPWDVPAITAGFAEAYAEVGRFLTRHRLQPTGAPVGIDGAMDPKVYHFEAGMPIASAAVAPDGNVRIKTTYAGPALKVVHVGSYDGLPQLHERMGTWLAAHATKATGPTLSRYLDDPAKVEPGTARTELYWPVD